MSALVPADRRRLEQLVALAGSSAFDGEAVNALRAACRLAAGNGLDLLEALRVSAAAQLDMARITALEQDAYRRGYQKAVEDGGAQGPVPASWPALADRLLQQHVRLLYEWERGFCASYLSSGWPEPTLKQRAIFAKLAARCGLRTPTP
jgi:hypothetical protein